MPKSKNKGFTDQEKALLRKLGYDPRFWEPLNKQQNSVIIKNRCTGEVKIVYMK